MTAKHDESEYMGLTRAEIEAEQQLLADVPFFNWAALCLPPVWGPAHGLWMTIIWYPLWMLADNCFFAAYSLRTPLSIAVASIVFVVLVAATFLFARLAQPYALHRALDKLGWTKEKYLARQRVWTVVAVVMGLIMLMAATYYNVAVRGGL